MQLSVTKAYPGFDPEAHLLSFKIYLDGVLVRNAIAFDTDAGTVVTLGALNDFTPPPKETVHRGKVEIKDFDSEVLLAATPDKK